MVYSYEYFLENKEKLYAHHKKYIDTHKEQHYRKVKCDVCNKEVSFHNIYVHRKTDKHQKNFAVYNEFSNILIDEIL